jgi:N-acyl homoserine lactone hydrolase
MLESSRLIAPRLPPRHPRVRAAATPEHASIALRSNATTVAGLPVYVHTIEHADGVVLVDTGMIDSTPDLDEECEPVPMPENIPRDVVCVINTHLHFDHCGGNRLFPGVPIHVQRLELQGPYDPAGWVDFPGATYVEHDGEAEVLPRDPAAAEARPHARDQSVLVDTPDGLVVIGGDVAYTFGELGSAYEHEQASVLASAIAARAELRDRPPGARRTGAKVRGGESLQCRRADG